MQQNRTKDNGTALLPDRLPRLSVALFLEIGLNSCFRSSIQGASLVGNGVQCNRQLHEEAGILPRARLGGHDGCSFAGISLVAEERISNGDEVGDSN